jgi:hypothetical protein
MGVDQQYMYSSECAPLKIPHLCTPLERHLPLKKNDDTSPTIGEVLDQQRDTYASGLLPPLQRHGTDPVVVDFILISNKDDCIGYSARGAWSVRARTLS